MEMFTNVQIDNVQAVDTLAVRGSASTSTKALEHFAQIHQNQIFQNFDYGESGNLERYGSPTPPQFDLRSIHGFPIATMTGELDLDGGERDERWLLDQITDVLVFSRTYEKFAHYDFLVAQDTEVYLLDVLDLLSEYNN